MTDLSAASARVEIAPLAWALLERTGELLPCLLGAALFATLRIALQRSHPSRVLAGCRSVEERERLEPLLGHADRLATSASVFEITCRAAFVALLARALLGERGATWLFCVQVVLVAVPCVLVCAEALPAAVALRRGDAILRQGLLAFHRFQMPLRWLVAGFEALRRAFMRMVGLKSEAFAPRHIVEGLRDVLDEAEISRDLDDTEREIIGNVIEFRDVVVSAVMTPRTAIQGVEVGDGLLAAAHLAAESGHSRIPIYDKSLDTIVGVVTARDLVSAAAEGRLEEGSLRGLLRPAYFVPETKRVSALLAEFRKEGQKLAFVLDEYGGTAGLVTLGDLVRELVGEVSDEFDAHARDPVRHLPDGAAEVDATLRVSALNEELALAIPEDAGFETLAGFVLSEFGRFPKRGETFARQGIEYRVLEASDRRVLKVLVKR